MSPYEHMHLLIKKWAHIGFPETNSEIRASIIPTTTPTYTSWAPTFHNTPEDMVVGITFLLRLCSPCPSWKKAVTTISHRALFVLADTGTGTGCTTSRYDEEDGNAESREEADQGQEQEGGVGVLVGEVEEAEIVLWGEWGPRTARVISPPTFHWITVHAGQPWLSLDDKLVIRDFSTARVLGSRVARGAGATAAHHILSGSPAYLHYNNNNNNAGKNED